jgi:hypothetical protein
LGTLKVSLILSCVGLSLPRIQEPAENANVEAVRDWQYKKKVAAEENVDKDFSQLSNTQSSEPIRGPKRRKTKRLSSSSTPVRATPKPARLSPRQVPESPSPSDKKEHTAHDNPAEIKDSYEEDIAFSGETPATKIPIVEIPPASKNWDPSEYRQISIYSQDTQPLPTYSDSYNSSQKRRSSPIRFFQPSSRPRNPFEEIPSDHKPASGEPAGSASLVIPDSQEYLASGSYDPSPLPSTGTDSVPSQSDTQSRRGDSSLLAITEDHSDGTQATLTTETSPTGSSSYRPGAGELQDSEAADPASFNQESVLESSNPAPQISQQAASLNLIATSLEDSSLESDTALQSCSAELTELDNSLGEHKCRSEEQDVKSAVQETASSGLVPILSQSPNSQRSQTRSPPRDSEDEGYSEPSASELINQ